MAAACLKTFGRHLWHLCEKVVPFSPFIEGVSDTDTRAIALQIMHIPAASKCGAEQSSR